MFKKQKKNTITAIVKLEAYYDESYKRTLIKATADLFLKEEFKLSYIVGKNHVENTYIFMGLKDDDIYAEYQKYVVKLMKDTEALRKEVTEELTKCLATEIFKRGVEKNKMNAAEEFEKMIDEDSFTKQLVIEIKIN